jgi:hypothetical protein
MRDAGSKSTDANGSQIGCRLSQPRVCPNGRMSYDTHWSPPPPYRFHRCWISTALSMASNRWTGNITASQLWAIYAKKRTILLGNTWILSIGTISARTVSFTRWEQWEVVVIPVPQLQLLRTRNSSGSIPVYQILRWGIFMRWVHSCVSTTACNDMKRCVY